MFEKHHAEFLQASTRTGKPYTEDTGKLTFWTFALDVFTDGCGNNVANMAVYHPKIKHGVQSINDAEFRTAAELCGMADKLMSRAAKSKPDTFVNLSEFTYGSVQRVVLHQQIKGFVNEVCKR